MSKGTMYFAKVKEGAIIPTKNEEDAGYDIYICTDEEYIKIEPNETIMLPTGIASACDDTYCFVIKERGSTGTIGIGQRAGLIEGSYRGEWFIPVTNHNEVPLIIAPKGKKAGELSKEYNAILYPMDKAIAQFIVVPVPKMTTKVIKYDELLSIESIRGTGALGSTGK